MKILFVGQLGYGQTSRMRMEALARLGHQLAGVDSAAPWRNQGYLRRRVQQALAWGPAVDELNRQVLETATRFGPQLLWAEKQEYLRPETLGALRARRIRLVHYTPDPYLWLDWKRTRLQDSCLPDYDVVLHAKRYEDEAYRRLCRKVVYVPLGFCEEMHRPLFPASPADRRRFEAEVGFVGGWEPRREHLLEAMVAAALDVKIWGYAWDHFADGWPTPRRYLRLRRLAGHEPFSMRKNARLAAAVQGGEVYGDDYAYALSGAAIGIGFLRTTVCPDQHTTRTFEIPACGSLLLADRTDEHRELFTEGEEADFFSSQAELLDKLHFYRRHPEIRARVAARGRQRCLNSGYSYRARLALAMKEIEG